MTHQTATTVTVPAQTTNPAPQTTPAPASGAVQGTSAHWAVTAALGLAVAGLALHQIPGMVPVVDAVGSLAGGIGTLTAVLLTRRR
ncbi:hypothetical protein SNE510_60830 [Streptomyces sp. NE5-10]|uniref:hypothetical protein n=1 Tax=Streptomyces sp. NE5-10 TaxID=2759674 RepID=UPI001906BC45|nr:hypothetical protein [Streptomyces sp. NE5-10]GHJ96564.1 hypothetical protein SNE510_60830 [Streptomyces sp. NE5-10]